MRVKLPKLYVLAEVSFRQSLKGHGDIKFGRDWGAVGKANL